MISIHSFKRSLLLLVFLFLSTLSFAQLNCPTFSRYGGFDRFEISPLVSTVDPYPGVGDLDFTNQPYIFGGDYTDNSFAAGAIFRFFADEHIAIRLKGIFTQRNVHDFLEVTDTINDIHSIFDDRFKQTLFKIAPGLQWTFFQDHISLYGGLEVPFTYQGDLTQNEYLLTDEPTDSIFLETYGVRTVPGGYSIGLGVFAGTAYYFTRSFAVGAELSTAFQYTSVGGDIISTSETFGSSSSTGGAFYNETMKFYRFSPVQGSLFVTVRF